jgi:hypothetical protein
MSTDKQRYNCSSAVVFLSWYAYGSGFGMSESFYASLLEPSFFITRDDWRAGLVFLRRTQVGESGRRRLQANRVY